MKNSNRQFDETGAFLDLMTKKERKRWEKEQAKLKEEEKSLEERKIDEEKNANIEENTKEIKSDIINEEIETKDEFEKDDTNSLESIAETITQEEKEAELEKTKQILNITQEITTTNELENKEEHTEETTISFNPTIPLGITLILLFVSYIYLSLFTNYNNITFLIINSIILGFLTLCFGLTILSNKKHVKGFAIFDLIIILGFIIFNGVSIINYKNMYNKVVEEVESNDNQNEDIVNKPNNKDEEENKIINEFICLNNDETIELTIYEENNYIVSLSRTETFKDEETMNKIIKFYEDIDGIEIDTTNLTLTLEFNFNILDINQYKIATENHNNYYRLEANFDYIEDNTINYEKYIDIEAKNLICKKVEN